MDVVLFYFDGCANWKTTERLLREVLERLGSADRPALQRVNTPEKAVELAFPGSPTVLVNGEDPFADLDAAVGLACRLYATEDGSAGSPTLQQLTQALTARL